MNANETPDERVAAHMANGPETWQVVKAADRLWHVVTTEENSYVVTSAPTKRAAMAACSEGFYFKHWHDRARWYAGGDPGRSQVVGSVQGRTGTQPGTVGQVSARDPHEDDQPDVMDQGVHIAVDWWTETIECDCGALVPRGEWSRHCESEGE